MPGDRKRRTLLPSMTREMRMMLGSALFALAAVALIAWGVALIFVPAGVITAGVGCVALQQQFFAGE